MKMTAVLKSWTARKLSFSGRVLLIQSVLCCLQMYWSSIFMLTKKVVKAFEEKFNWFLWKGLDEGKIGRGRF